MRVQQKLLVCMLVLLLCGPQVAAPAHADILRVAPIIFTAMTHTDAPYDTDKNFTDEVARIQAGLSLYASSGVKMNLEASKEFAKRDKALSVRNGLPTFLQTVIDAGHGVGTHCNDVRAFQDPPVPPLLPEIVAKNKAAVDAALDDASNNISVSGICSRQDWVAAAAAAQFKITDAVTGLCYLSMSTTARPADWTDDLIKSTYYHDSAPLYFANRISPMRLQDASDFTSDDPGVLTVSNGELGELASLSECRATCSSSCTLDSDDLEVVYAAIERVRLQKRPTEVGRINIHVPISLFDATNHDLMQAFVNKLAAYAAAGIIVFGTQKDVLDTYEAWR